MRYFQGIILLLMMFCLSCAQPQKQTHIIVPTGPDSGIIKTDGDTEHIDWHPDGTFVWDAPVGDRALFAFPLPDGASFGDY
ncbi:MAG: hypothetical protein JXB48_15255, partial [Candidatus Latescibacteria bacterium]|nr:hypothetical protein [Candidatus Latescibacterota bacterium]